MEDLNAWLSSAAFESPDGDFAIRKFCPARLEQEVGEELPEMMLDDFELFFEPTGSPLLRDSEVDELVDSFINVDQCLEEDNSNNNTASEDKDRLNVDQDEIDIAIEGIDLMIGGDIFNVGAAPQLVPSNEGSNCMDRGLHQVHMLLACAEAVSCRDARVADSILHEIWSRSSPWGDSLQRVSYCFAIGLKSRITLLYHLKSNRTFKSNAANSSQINRKEKQEAFHLLHQATPYISFAFLAANSAIFEAAEGSDSLHVVDLGMENTLQWPYLIRVLASRPEGPPKVRITGLVCDHDHLELETSMNLVVDDATSLGIQLKFHLIAEPLTPSLLTREKLNLTEGEALVFNSILQLHKSVKESRGSLRAILQAVKRLGPTAMVVVEQDAHHNGPFFLGRFLESLHYYSAIFDSLEAGLPRNSLQRMKIERLHFAEQIHNIVACEGSDRTERHERADQWRRQLGRAGFQAVGLKCMNQASMMLSASGSDGYTLGSEKGCLLLGWKGRPIMLASAWQVNNVNS